MEKIDLFVRVTPDLKDSNKLIYFANDEFVIERFRNSFINEHQGVVEFIGCVHALMYMKKNDLHGDIFVENEYIKKCVEAKKYPHHARSEKGIIQLRKSKLWLSDQRKTIIINIR